MICVCAIVHALQGVEFKTAAVSENCLLWSLRTRRISMGTNQTVECMKLNMFCKLTNYLTLPNEHSIAACACMK